MTTRAHDVLSPPPVAQDGGACTCDARSLETCTCEWGETIRDMITLGYHTEPLRRAELLPELMIRATRVIAAARAGAIRASWHRWPGTQLELARRLHISAGRIRQFTTGEQTVSR